MAKQKSTPPNKSGLRFLSSLGGRFLSTLLSPLKKVFNVCKNFFKRYGRQDGSREHSHSPQNLSIPKSIQKTDLEIFSNQLKTHQQRREEIPSPETPLIRNLTLKGWKSTKQ